MTTRTCDPPGCDVPLDGQSPAKAPVSYSGDRGRFCQLPGCNAPIAPEAGRTAKYCSVQHRRRASEGRRAIPPLRTRTYDHEAVREGMREAEEGRPVTSMQVSELDADTAVRLGLDRFHYVQAPAAGQRCNRCGLHVAEHRPALRRLWPVVYWLCGKCQVEDGEPYTQARERDAHSWAEAA